MVGQAGTMPGVTEPRPSATREGVTRRRLRLAGWWGLTAIAFDRDCPRGGGREQRRRSGGGADPPTPLAPSRARPR